MLTFKVGWLSARRCFYCAFFFVVGVVSNFDKKKQIFEEHRVTASGFTQLLISFIVKHNDLEKRNAKLHELQIGE